MTETSEAVLERQTRAQIPKGCAFSVVLVTEAVGNKLIKLRSPLKVFEWQGDWAVNSKLWD